jgi:hypothetical protein
VSRKDYVAVADALHQTKEDSREILGSYSVLCIAGRIADAFEQDNASFDRVRFLTASGFPPAE